VTLATPCYPGDPVFAGNQTLIDRDHAHAFWGTHSFGIAWSELAHPASVQDSLPLERKLKDVDRLTRQIRSLELASGCAQVTDLLDWSMSCDWSPARFFTALQHAIESGRVLDENGLLLKNPHHYS
jgi:hypothetical protein